MPQVQFSVIVVSWNVRDYLRRCLVSLEREQGNASLEVIVVDNASSDGSIAMVRREFPGVKLIIQSHNLGFARGCNLAVSQAQGRYLLFLNPDAEVTGGFFSDLERTFVQRPKAGVVGGHIVNDNGSTQASVRAFPTLWPLALDVLKILNRLPWLAPAYLLPRFDYAVSQPVDQVMGACFAVPQAVWERLGGFNESFFIWFEEVDFCERLRAAGYEVWYESKLTLTHSQARSFAQLSYWQRHSNYAASLLCYAGKHLGKGAKLLLRVLSWFGYVAAAVADCLCPPQTNKDSSSRWLLTGLLLFMALDVCSFIGWSNPWFGTVAAVLLTVVWLVLASRDLSLGVALLVIELILGSQGYWFSLKIGETVLSLRLLLFLAAFGLLVWRLVARRTLKIFSHPMLWWYAGAVAALVLGTVVAALRGNDYGNLFLDLNGYLYLGLFPLFIEAVTRGNFITWLKKLALPALVWLTFKTLLALYLFSHLTPDALLPFYQWWRQTGLGEITSAGGGFFRIFSQSHVWVALAVSMAWVYLWQRLNQPIDLKKDMSLMLMLLVALIALLASLSRSFWLGVVVVWIITPLFGRGFSLTRLGRYVLYSLMLSLAAAGLLLATTKVAWPLPPIADSSAEVFAQRFGAGEAAGQSRLQLFNPLLQAALQHPVIGSGFGATVTYRTQDPRLVSSTAGGSGIVTTYAFEWGYLDLWLKLGLVGLLLYFGFMLRGLWPGIYALRTKHELQIMDVVLLTAVALAVLNITTPYLNHPLGLGALMLFISLAWQEQLSPAKSYGQ